LNKSRVAELSSTSHLQKGEVAEQVFTKCLHRAPGADGQMQRDSRSKGCCGMWGAASQVQ